MIAAASLLPYMLPLPVVPGLAYEAAAIVALLRGPRLDPEFSTGSAAESMAKSMAKPVAEFIAEPIAEPIAQPLVEPAPAAAPYAPAVTILKPLHGEEPGLYENLRSFCAQEYPDFQVVFGVHHGGDPAVAVVHRLQQEFPQRDLQLVIDGRVLGANRKVGNLHNMLGSARHDVLVLSDADVRVEPGYLRDVVAPLADPGVGVVTCLYRGVPDGGVGSRLLAQWINEGFAPSVLVAQFLGPNTFCGGASLTLRRSDLDAVGGFAALADHLADDYLLGARTRGLGLRTVLSHRLVDTCVQEDSLASSYRHALRWSRTVRTVQPWGHAFSVLTLPLPLAVLVAPWGCWGWAALAAALALRCALHLAAQRQWRKVLPATDWTFLAVDFLGFAIWLHAGLGRQVRWRQEHFAVGADGRMEKGVLR